MNKKPTHSKLPFSLGYSDGSGKSDDQGYTIIANEPAYHDGSTIPRHVVMSAKDDWGVVMGIDNQPDAEFIILACNHHYKLIRALKNLINNCPENEQCVAARKVLAKAHKFHPPQK